MNYLYALPRNGYRETMELLEFHKSSSILEIKAFFEHYYKSQWYVCEHIEDEKVLDIVMENSKKIL